MAETKMMRPPALEVTAPYRPTQVAVALAYNDGARAPRVVAKGRGVIAESIIARAKEAGVFVHESSALVSLLMQLDLDEHIPPELYRAVAEVLAFLHTLERQAGDKSNPVSGAIADLLRQAITS